MKSLRFSTNLRWFRYLMICAGLAALLPATASADLMLNVRVFLVCDDAGANCPATGPVGDPLYTAEVNKIWAQAGIAVHFSPAGRIDSTQFMDIDDGVAGDGFADLAAAYGTHGPSTSLVDLFLVHTVAGSYGEAWLGFGGLVIAMDTVMGFGSGNPYYPNGRIDTIAHELGHNLGLVGPAQGGDAGGHSTNRNYLMASGGIRNIPGSVTDIAPDGMGWDQLPADQIAVARGSSLFVLPEPGSIVLIGTVLLGIAGTLRRRSKV